MGGLHHDRHLDSHMNPRIGGNTLYSQTVSLGNRELRVAMHADLLSHTLFIKVWLGKVNWRI